MLVSKKYCFKACQLMQLKGLVVFIGYDKCNKIMVMIWFGVM